MKVQFQHFSTDYFYFFSVVFIAFQHVINVMILNETGNFTGFLNEFPFWKIQKLSPLNACKLAYTVYTNCVNDNLSYIYS